MFGGHEDAGGVVDADGRVAGGVHDQKSLVQRADERFEGGTADVLDEALADAEAAAREVNFGVAVGCDAVQRVAEIVRDVAGVEGCADGDDGLCAGDFGGGFQNRRAAQRVADQQRGRHAALGEDIRRAHQVFDIGGERGVGELAAGMAETGEIEAQHGDAHAGKARGDAAGGGDVLAAGEAMREERGRQVRALGQVEAGGEVLARMAGEGEAIDGHGADILSQCRLPRNAVRASHVTAR